MSYDEWFGFTLGERRGIVAFIVLTLGLIFTYSALKPKLIDPIVDLSEYYFQGDSLNGYNDDPGRMTESVFYSQRDNKKPIIRQKFAFNPNRISYDSLLLLGFSPYAAKSLTGYVSKGGTIYDVERLKSVYGVDSELIDDLEGYIYYPKREEYPRTDWEKITAERDSIYATLVVELNTSDSLELSEIRGIGLYTAGKIIRMRERLGGYLYKEQLLELDVIPDSLYTTIKNHLSVNTAKVRKINLNTADYRTFMKHPYFPKEVINKILKYRNQHGNFAKVEHIRRIISLSEEEGERIIPYMMVE